MGIGIIGIIGILTILYLLYLLYLLYYYYFIVKFKFWKNQGIPGPEPLPIFGNAKDIIFGKISVGNYIKEEYRKYKNYPMFGIFLNRDPVLIVNDPEIIKEVLIKQFSTFSSRGYFTHEKIEPLLTNIFSLEYARWKPLRAKESIIFTSGKIKGMFNLLLECANKFEKVIEKTVDQCNIIDCSKLTTRFSTDVLGNCFLGIDPKALEDENSHFHKTIKKFTTNVNRWRSFKNLFKQLYPFLFSKLGFIMRENEINELFSNTVLKIMKHKKDNNIKKGDFVDLLMELKANSDYLNGIELTDVLLIAQAFGIYIAGVDTSPLTIDNILYELALNQPIQNKLREEINEVLMHNNGKLEYGNIKDMKYLDKVFNETLRKHPIIGFLQRESVSSYKFSKPNVTIPKNTRVWIPVSGIHENPEFYKNPEIFDPERFSEENVKERQACVYLPFGDGPRNCIALRFATIQVKVAIITIIQKFKIESCDKTPLVVENNPIRCSMGPKSGFQLKFTKLN